MKREAFRLRPQNVTHRAARSAHGQGRHHLSFGPVRGKRGQSVSRIDSFFHVRAAAALGAVVCVCVEARGARVLRAIIQKRSEAQLNRKPAVGAGAFKKTHTHSSQTSPTNSSHQPNWHRTDAASPICNRRRHRSTGRPAPNNARNTGGGGARFRGAQR